MNPALTGGSRVVPLRRTALHSIVDQAIVSLSNFMVALLVARRLGPAGLGVFGAVFAGWLLALGIFRSVVVEPFIVAAPHLTVQDLAESEAVSRIRGLRVAAALGGLIVLAGLPLLLLSPRWGLTLVAAGLAVPPMLFQDLCRWQSIAIQATGRAVRSDLTLAMIELGLILCLAPLDLLAPSSAFVCMGIGSIVASLGFRRPRLVELRGKGTRRPKAGPARWFLADFLSTWVTWQGSLLAVVLLLGVEQAGVFRAMTDLFGPGRMLLLGIGSVALPATSRRHADQGLEGLRLLVGRLLLVVVCGAILYVATIGAASHVILKSIYGDDFAAHASLTWILGAEFILTAVRYPVTAGLKSAGMGDRLFRSRRFAPIIGMLAVLALVPAMGIAGAALGATMAAAGMTLGPAWQMRKLS